MRTNILNTLLNALKRLLFNDQEQAMTQDTPNNNDSSNANIERKPTFILTLEDWITSSGKYPERASSPELTYEVKSAAMLLVDKVNAFIRASNMPEAKVSSGFRPSAVNSQIAHAAKRSGHTRGLAIDFSDPTGSLDELVNKDENQTILESLGLWQEHPSKTINWMHLDLIIRSEKERPNCKKRQFMP